VQCQLSDLTAQLAGAAGVRVELARPELDGTVSLRVRDLPIGTILVALSVASGLPVGSLDPPGHPACVQYEDHVFGGQPGEQLKYASLPLDARLVPHLNCEADVASLVAGLTDDEQQTLRRTVIPARRLAPRLRHAVWRHVLEGGPPLLNGVDYLLARLGRPLDLYVFVSAEGDIAVAARRCAGSVWAMRVGRLADGRVEGEGPGSPVLLRAGPASVTRPASFYCPLPEDPDKDGPVGTGRWMWHAGPVARPNGEGR